MKKNNTNLLWMAAGAIGAWFLLREKSGKVNKDNNRYHIDVSNERVQDIILQEKDINEISKDDVLPFKPAIDVSDKIIL